MTSKVLLIWWSKPFNILTSLLAHPQTTNIWSSRRIRNKLWTSTFIHFRCVYDEPLAWLSTLSLVLFFFISSLVVVDSLHIVTHFKLMPNQHSATTGLKTRCVFRQLFVMSRWERAANIELYLRCCSFLFVLKSVN